jgi:hypothetical protein
MTNREKAERVAKVFLSNPVKTIFTIMIFEKPFQSYTRSEEEEIEIAFSGDKIDIKMFRQGKRSCFSFKEDIDIERYR